MKMTKKKYCYEYLCIEDLPGEEWKRIENYPLYQVSNFGRIKSITYERFVSNGYTAFHTEKIMRQTIGKKGYLYVTIRENGKRHTLLVSRLVANAFIPNPHNLPEVNHKSEDKKDNTVFNLEWVSHQHNSDWGTRNERIGKANKGVKRTAEQKERLSIAHGFPVKCEGKKFNSITKCAQHYGVPHQTMTKWLNGVRPMPPEWKDKGLKYIKRKEN